MKQYSAFVKDKQTGAGVILKNREYKSKADFIQDIRGNGYSVDPHKVKEAALFDYIMEHTNCEPWDWRMTSIPEN